MTVEAVRAKPAGATLARTAVLLICGLALLRLCHVKLLWADEDYHLAAALNILHGKIPYRDFWYDKPPLSAIFYLLIGAHPGWPLRLLDAAYVLAACGLIYRLARQWWGEREGRVAALLLAFYLAFYLPSAVIAFAADALMVAPHLGAAYCALQGRAFAAGLWCGLAFLVNVKALFVLAVCAVWIPAAAPLLVAGALVPCAAAACLAWFSGAWPGYWEQVWRWGWIYAAGSPVTRPLAIGTVRTLDWLGFHAAVAGGAAYGLARAPQRDRARLGSWLILSFAAVCLGTRFAPHYFLQLLPPMVVAGARGLVLAWDRYRRCAGVFAALALAVPMARFGPRYAMLAADDLRDREPHWSDVVLDLDSQHVAQRIRPEERAGDTLFVWGYRPDVYIYTRLTSDGKFWDSQPLTGVPADRHLQAREAIYGGPAARNRLVFARSRPAWLVDGLGVLNPHLAPAAFPDLRPFLTHYRLVSRTRLSLIYRRTD